VPIELPAADGVATAGSRLNGDAAALLGRQVNSSALAREVSVLVWETETVSGRRQSPQLDALARSWRKAFEGAYSALRVAGPYLTAKELGERRDRLAEERSKVARLLDSLASDLQVHSKLVRSLAAPTSL
jgi:hypothetical protein